jgi:hypothetical protein
MSAYLSRLAVPLGGIVKRSLAMVLYSCERAIAKAFGLDDATRDMRCVFARIPVFLVERLPRHGRLGLG